MALRPVATQSAAVRGVASWLLLTTTLVSSYVPADGPGGYGVRRQETETEYERTARDAYGAGYALIESADRFDQDAAATTDERTRREALSEASGKYEDALNSFNEAVRLEANMYEAHTYIGYANRKLRRYDPALAAYATALRLRPDYAPAIEYQAEAFLGMDRFEPARLNYLRLYALDAAQAQKLLEAMERWSSSRQRDGGNLSHDALTAASEWIAARRSTDKSSAKPLNAGW